MRSQQIKYWHNLWLVTNKIHFYFRFNTTRAFFFVLDGLLKISVLYSDELTPNLLRYHFTNSIFRIGSSSSPHLRNFGDYFYSGFDIYSFERSDLLFFLSCLQPCYSYQRIWNARFFSSFYGFPVIGYIFYFNLIVFSFCCVNHKMV